MRSGETRKPPLQPLRAKQAGRFRGSRATCYSTGYRCSMRSLWNDADAARLPDLDGLLYASRQIGADTDLVVWGGGNTSVKRDEVDYLSLIHI